jgi:hypothetical protein
MHWTRYDIFLSYSHQDSEATDPFVDELRRRGYRVFYDKKSIVVGEQWKRRLGKGIRASRACILCWSENARNSEYVAFEYSRAEGLGKPVLPWLLDETPLPRMMEIHGVVDRDPTRAVEQFLPRLGWRLSLRRSLQAAGLVLLLIASGIIYWRTHLPPPPWEFSGRVTDSETRFPIAGVEVDAEQTFRSYTDSDGRYLLHLPSPRPKYIHLVFLKQGYKGREPVNVLAADAKWDTDMTRIK